MYAQVYSRVLEHKDVGIIPSCLHKHFWGLFTCMAQQKGMPMYVYAQATTTITTLSYKKEKVQATVSYFVAYCRFKMVADIKVKVSLMLLFLSIFFTGTSLGF